MVTELACPRCNGRLPAGSEALVECPHCHEQIPVPAAGVPAGDARGRAASADAPLVETVQPADGGPSFPGLPRAESVSDDSFLLAAAAAAGISPAEMRARIQENPRADAAGQTVPAIARRADDDARPSHADDGSGDIPPAPDHRSPAPAGAAAVQEPLTLDPRSADVETLAAHRTAAPALPERTENRPASVADGAATLTAPRRRGVPPLYFAMVCSYAVLATALLALIFVMVFVLGAWPRPHQLEHLPDVVPREDARGDIEIPLYPEDANLPSGHELRPGDPPRRFGNLEVQVLRVTRGPLEFVHFLGDPDFQRDPAGPVLKLWLRFRNVSADQTFAPLGRALVYNRGRGRQSRGIRANNFICRVEPDAARRDCLLVYDHLLEDLYDLRDQDVERGLAPGEVFTTFIPSQAEGLDALAGQLVWRVHFRKGLGPSGWGVTTLLDVRFHSDEIMTEGEEIADLKSQIASTKSQTNLTSRCSQSRVRVF